MSLTIGAPFSHGDFAQFNRPGIALAALIAAATFRLASHYDAPSMIFPFLIGMALMTWLERIH